MTLFSWLRTRPANAPRTTAPRTRLGVEAMEDRTVPSWLTQVGGSSGELSSYGQAVDGAGNTYLSGLFTGTVDFDPSAGEDNRTATDASNVFVAKYDPEGDLAWVRQVSIPGYSLARVEVDGTGTPYLYGGYSGTGDFGNGAVYATGGGSDPYLMRLDPGTGQTVWARAAQTGSQYEVLWDVDFGADGCVYSTARFAGTADFDRTASYPDNRDLVTATGTTRSRIPSDAFVWKVGPDGGFRAAWGVGGGDSGESGYGIAVGVDEAGGGSLYLTGSFGGTTDLDPGAGTASRASAGAQDTFLARYAISGTALAFEWGVTAGGANYEQQYDLAADAEHLYLTGEFTGTADFHRQAAYTDGRDLLTSTGGSPDGVVAKYRKDTGGLVWARAVGGPGDENMIGPAVVTAAGSVYVGGRFTQAVDFDPAGSQPNDRDVLTSRGGMDGFVFKLDPAGQYQDAWRLGGGGDDTARVAAVTQTTAGPRVQVAGNFLSATADFPDGQLLRNPDGLRDAYLMTLDEAAPTAAPPPPVSVTGGAVSEGTTGGRTKLTFTVTLAWSSDQPVTLYFRTLDGTATAGSDYETAGGYLEFQPGETTKTVEVWAIGDTAVEANETFSLALYALDGRELARALGTITNDDTTSGGKPRK